MPSKQFHHGIDLRNNNQLKNFIVHQVDSDEVTALSSWLDTDHIGFFIYDTDADMLKIWSGVEFINISTTIEGDVIYKGSIDGSQSLDNQCSAVAGYQYLVSVAGDLSMSGVTFTYGNKAEVGDWLFFTSSVDALVIQASNIVLATHETAGTVKIATESDIIAGESDSSVVTPKGLYKAISEQSMVREFHTNVDLTAGDYVKIQHNLNLVDMDNFYYNAMSNSRKVNVEARSVNQDSIRVRSFKDMQDVTVTIIGQARKQLLVPVISSIKDSSNNNIAGGITSDTSLYMTILADSGTTVTVYDQGMPIGVAVESGTNGLFIFTTPNLSEGDHSIKVISEDITKKSQQSAVTNFSIDITMPDIDPNVFPGTITDIEGNLVSSGDTVKSTQLEFDITLPAPYEPDLLVEVYDEKSNTLLGVAQETSTQGNYSAILDAVDNDVNRIYLKITDPAGNQQETTRVYVTVDTELEDPVISLIRDDKGTPISQTLNREVAVTLTVNAEENTLVEIYNESTLMGSASETSAGSYEFQTPVLTEGLYSFTAVCIDSVLGSKTSDAYQLSVDTTLPNEPLIASITVG